MESLPMRERGLKCLSLVDLRQIERVAPHAGAWIEIRHILRASIETRSLPMRERGLK